jgi:pentapeptide MXKDX repeat protein
MPRRTRWLGRAVVVAVIGVALGFCGAVGESVAQDNVKKADTMKKDDKMKAGDTMKKGDMKSGDMKSDDTKKDGKAMMKDDKMMQADTAMDKKKQ